MEFFFVTNASISFQYFIMTYDWNAFESKETDDIHIQN